MKSSQLDNITVVIRSAQERTIKASTSLILKEVGEEDIYIIEERPFSEAVKKTFQIGLEKGKEWTLAIDADLLLIPGSISTMIKNAGEYSSELYMYQGHILDKFKGGIKQGGPHLYLTKNLNSVGQFYDEMERDLRPETFINKQMELLGFKVISDKKLFAFHDFHQFYKDIYRKSFFHGIKHHRWRSFLPIWMEKSEADSDFIIAVRGFIDGYYSPSKVYPSIEYLNNRFENEIVDAYQLIEKGELVTQVDFDFENRLLKYDILITPELRYFRNVNRPGERKYKTILKRYIKIMNSWF